MLIVQLHEANEARRTKRDVIPDAANGIRAVSSAMDDREVNSKYYRLCGAHCTEEQEGT